MSFPAGPPSTAAHARRQLGAVLFLLAALLPGAARPHTLEQLLHLPIERLLQLECSPGKVAQALGAGALSPLSVSRNVQRGGHAL